MQMKTQNTILQKRQLTLLDIYPFYFCASSWHVQKLMKEITDLKRNKEIIAGHSHISHTEGHMEMGNSVLTAINQAYGYICEWQRKKSKYWITT